MLGVFVVEELGGPYFPDADVRLDALVAGIDDRIQILCGPVARFAHASKRLWDLRQTDPILDFGLGVPTGAIVVNLLEARYTASVVD
ncbi:hypothetical protein HN358_00400 [Candidatus Uhrbacteria bacterium]|jgi:hypothetical protein|nr:hypothetical protein [Candidatus Uhrbacteria bacterium]MBT7717698.1 hypothetical protein [Candidatus Uhrbacteria bacterium]